MKAGNLRLVQKILPMEVIDPDRMTDVKKVVMIGMIVETGKRRDETTEEITETEIEIIEIVIENPELKNLGSIVKMVNLRDNRDRDRDNRNRDRESGVKEPREHRENGESRDSNRDSAPRDGGGERGGA